MKLMAREENREHYFFSSISMHKKSEKAQNFHLYNNQGKIIHLIGNSFLITTIIKYFPTQFIRKTNTVPVNK